MSDYIKKELEKGFSLKKIKKELVKAGHNIGHIEKEFASFESKKEKKIFSYLKNYWPIILIVLFLVILIIVFIKTGPSFKSFKGLSSDQVSEEQVQKTLLQSMVDECKLISNSKLQGVCLLKAAKQFDNISVCSQISSSGNDIFYYACTDKIWENGDCGYENLIGDSDSCWFNRAVKEKNFLFCESISLDEPRLLCEKKVLDLASSNKNASFCGGAVY